MDDYRKLLMEAAEVLIHDTVYDQNYRRRLSDRIYKALRAKKKEEANGYKNTASPGDDPDV